MEILNWVAEHWILSIVFSFPLFLIFDALQSNIFKVGTFMYNRTLRTIKVLFRGWPPEHLDADGDYINQNKKGKE